jgi:hypothetical protein
MRYFCNASLFFAVILAATPNVAHSESRPAVAGESCTLLYNQCADAVTRRGYSPNEQCVPAHAQCLQTGIWQTTSKQVTSVERR